MFCIEENISIRKINQIEVLRQDIIPITCIITGKRTKVLLLTVSGILFPYVISEE